MSELTTRQMVDQMDVILRNLPARNGIPKDARVIYCDVLQAWGERLKMIEEIDLTRLRELAEAEREGRVVVLNEIFKTPIGQYGFIYYDKQGLMTGDFCDTKEELEALRALSATAPTTPRER